MRENSAKEPGSRQIEVAGYVAWQATKKDTCTQDVIVSPKGNFFRTIVNRVEKPKGVTTGHVCEIAAKISEIILETLKTTP